MRVFENYEQLRALEQAAFVTVGFFDGVHRGHQYLFRSLADAAAAVDAAPLVITFSNSPRNYHQQPAGDLHPRWRYLSTCEEKLDLLELHGVENVLLLQYDETVCSQTALQFLQGVARGCRIAGFCAGYDTSIGRDMLSGREAFQALTQELGIALKFVEPFAITVGMPGAEACVVVKSSLARELVAAGDLDGARRILGHRYFISGQVVPGKGLGGAQLGIHTANLHIPPEKITPPLGIYAAWADVLSERYPAATALADPQRAFDTVLDRQAAAAPKGRPGHGWMVAEAHLAGFEGKLYGEHLRLSFVRRLRGWEDFDSAAGLAEQMRRDIEQAVSACRPEVGDED